MQKYKYTNHTSVGPIQLQLFDNTVFYIGANVVRLNMMQIHQRVNGTEIHNDKCMVDCTMVSQILLYYSIFS